MKKLLLAAIMAFSLPAFAEQTAGEKVKDSAKDTTRAVKKGAHRAGEKLCMKDDSKCLADKAKHRATESSDAVKDKASEVKDRVD